jgi:glycosyltransferase involved in cell wall biosynthesis
MKVLLLSTWKEVCGIANYTADLVTALEASGVLCEVHALNRRDRKYMSRSAVAKDFSQFTKKARAFDLVHIQHEFSFFADSNGTLPRSIRLFRFVLKRLAKERKPTVVTFHTEPYFTIPFWRILGRPRHICVQAKNYALSHLWRRNISCFFDGSYEQFRAVVHTRRARLTVKKSGFSYQNTDVVPIGVAARNRAFLCSDHQVAKEKLGYRPDTILLSLFGFVSAYKGPYIALDALRKLPERYHLALVGGPHPESQENTINDILRISSLDESLRGRVRITGYQKPDVVDMYHTATDFCLAPYVDPRISGSAAITWALSSGKPVIASKLPTFVDINDTSDSMLLFTPGASHELAWQIQRLTANRDLVDYLIQNARNYVTQNSWPMVAEKTVDVYKKMVDPGLVGLPTWAAGNPWVHEGNSQRQDFKPVRRKRGTRAMAVSTDIRLPR